MAREATPVWVWIGCGCVGVIGLVVAGFMALGFVGVSKMQGYVETLEDPDRRRARVLEMLGAEELPPEYNAQFFVSVPYILDMALLSDAPPYEGDFEEGEAAPEWDMGRRGLAFVAVRDFGDDRARVLAQLESDDPRLDLDDLEQDVETGIDFEGDEILARGRVAVPPQEIVYVTERGELRVQGDRVGGVATSFFVVCPDDARLRVGLWYEADAEPATAGETPPEATDAPPVLEAPPTAARVGVGDDAVRDFFGYFDLCRA